MIPHVLRALAILIALIGAIDPAITSTRMTKPTVVVVTSDSSFHRALVQRVATALDRRFAVVAAPFGPAAGTVVVGNDLPASAEELASPVFVVSPARDAPSVTIEDVRVPARAPLDARVSVAVSVHAVTAVGRRIDIALRMGNLVVDRISRDITRDDERHDVSLGFIPTAIGAVPLRVTAELSGAASSASADAAVDIRDQRRAVLFFDPRPSWMSTFVRRAIERDPRFIVTSRVVTSRNVSTDAGRPPGTLDDRAVVSSFDAIVVGAPEALSERDVTGLEAYLRRQGGTVVLLLDQRGRGAYERLTRVREWTGARNSAGLTVRWNPADSGGLRASEVAWPATLPVGARSVGTTDGHPVIWQSAVGAGRLVVTGALDAWRFRDPAVSRFDSFWRTTIADAVDRGPRAVAIDLDHAVVGPGEKTGVTVTVRAASLAELSSTRPVRATVVAAIETPDGGAPVRLWPDGPIGRFRGSFRAPATPGIFRIVVTGDGIRGDAPVIVADSVARPTPDNADLLATWAASRGGMAVSASELDDLIPMLERTLDRTPRRETWYPMRSPWWIVPFALALGAEWFWRRRRGEA